jgi:hypothetical protein
MIAVAKRSLVALVLLMCAAFIADYLQLRYRIQGNHQPYGTVTLQITYAISEKAGEGARKTEFASGGTEDRTCANSLFPQLGLSPCWYLRRHTQKQVDM